MNNHDLPRRATPLEVADQVAKTYFGVTDEFSRRRVIRRCLLGAAEAAVLTPCLFYLGFREVGPLGWGTTVFFVVYLLLTAFGLYFRPRTEYHSPVPLRGDWRDRVGAFWLVGCVFGPFFGWVVTSGAFPITQSSWQWMYGLRVLLAAVVPLMLALPLTRYVRGKSAWVALPLLVGVTLLPVSSAMNVSLDLWEGPIVRQERPTGQSELFLKHTGRSLGAATELHFQSAANQAMQLAEVMTCKVWPEFPDTSSATQILSITKALFFEPKPMQLQRAMLTSAFLA